MGDATVISIATHGLIPRDFEGGKGASGLVFTPPPQATAFDDGFLQGPEIAAMTFQADWIILSACNTATSDTALDSFSSLIRAFLFSGGKAVLASHWRVNDAATPDVILKTLEQNHALTQAKGLQAAEDYVRNIKGYAHPRYWAAFSIISNRDR